MTKVIWWSALALLATMFAGACASDAAQTSVAASPSAPPTPAVADPTADTAEETADTQADTTATEPLQAAGFVASIGGAVYQTDSHDCFDLGDGAVAVSGEGAGPSGPFQFFMQAGKEEELSFQAGDFVVFSLPTDSDLRFETAEGRVSAWVTLAQDKVLAIAGQCEAPAQSAAASGEAGAELLESSSGMIASLDGRTYEANSFGCAATASGIAITGTGVADDGTFFTLCVETGRDVASISVDGADVFASAFSGQGTVSITQDGTRFVVDAIATNGQEFALVAPACDE